MNLHARMRVTIVVERKQNFKSLIPYFLIQLKLFQAVLQDVTEFADSARYFWMRHSVQYM
jgi:hypothetical protein